VVVALAWAGLVAAVGCGDDAASSDPPIIVGPYARDIALEADTRAALPRAREHVGIHDAPRFYWHHPGVAGETLTFELRAEATALEQGTVVHTATVEVPEDAHPPQGLVDLHPTEFNQGGARRNRAGNLEWLPGTYSLKGRTGGEIFATLVFEVR